MANVPINDNPRINQYVATNGQTVFPWEFWVDDEEDLRVYRNGTLQTIIDDYTVEANGVRNDDGGAITFVSGLDADDEVTITCESSIDRESGFSESGTSSFRPEILNLEFARFIVMIQERSRDIARCLRLSAFSTYAGSLLLPDASAGKALKWADDGLSIVNSDNDPDEQVAEATARAEAASTSASNAATSEANAASSASAAATSEANAAQSALDAEAVGNGVLTTKGDLVTYHTGAAQRLGVGANNQILTADSGQAAGLKWADPSAASDTAAGVTEYADQAEMEAASSNTRSVTPGRLHHHPGVAKAWVNFNGTGTVAIRSSYNVSSVTDNGTGYYEPTYTTPFSNTNYGAWVSRDAPSTNVDDTRALTAGLRYGGKAVGSCRIITGYGNTEILEDAEQVSFLAFGDH